MQLGLFLCLLLTIERLMCLGFIGRQGLACTDGPPRVPSRRDHLWRLMGRLIVGNGLSGTLSASGPIWGDLKLEKSPWESR